ncbi:M23 family metallopeptidase [Streptomyces sp. H27-D2]|uniref:M23 family metallopeptidase n=1 Tax=Streptomyces sp. H27-D2 TaxID=3046304 RepID=UPI002DB70D1D|nr:M23 family metallopeptidase [Streptomyces sp. H27-D2]MEC4015830.1 M23 family metallopeptidase [Streptomyces sp. H27-D2]
MAFIRANGKHRRPNRAVRTGANAAGIATLAVAGVVGAVASPAIAAENSVPKVEQTGLQQAIVIDGTLAQNLDDQATVQHSAADVTQAREKAEADAMKQAADAKKAAEAKRRAAAEKAEKAKEAREAKAEKARQAEPRAARSEGRTAIKPNGSGYVSPISGSYVSTQYKASGGAWSSGSHTGIDFHAASGTAVHAVGAGTVVEAGWGGAYGNNVVIKMNDGSYTQYGHLSSSSVTVGQSVTAGQQIALSGNTGNTTGPHLHFEARTGAEYGSDIDPIGYLRSHGVSV